MAHLYFTDAELGADSAVAEITGDEAHHAAQVARLREGESILVSDGRGWTATGIAREVTKSRVTVDISALNFEEPRTPEFTLVQALAKGDRDELAVQACTELGVSRVIPWQADRSVSRWDADKAVKGVARWQSIAREAAKQSVRSRVPAVTAPVTTKNIVAACEGADVLVLDPRADHGLGDWVRAHPTPTAIALIVGPEGGISDAEVAQLVEQGAVPVRLGTDIMRTSTAGSAAIAALSALLGLW